MFFKEFFFKYVLGEMLWSLLEVNQTKLKTTVYAYKMFICFKNTLTIEKQVLILK